MKMMTLTIILASFVIMFGFTPNGLAEGKKEKKIEVKSREFEILNKSVSQVKLELDFLDGKNLIIQLNPSESKKISQDTAQIKRYKLYIKPAGKTDYETEPKLSKHLKTHGSHIKLEIVSSKAPEVKEEHLNYDIFINKGK